MAGRGGRMKPWQRDQHILDRLEEHARLLRQTANKTVAREVICRRQQISEETFYLDERRLRELHRQAIAADYGELVAEVDAGYREVIADADALTTTAEQSGAKAAHQANKLKALDSRVHLHGLAKPVTQQFTG